MDERSESEPNSKSNELKDAKKFWRAEGEQQISL